MGAYAQNEIAKINEELKTAKTEEEKEKLLDLKLKHQQNLSFFKDLV